MILNIYKEKNWTSFDVVAKIKGLLKDKEINRKTKIKVGHAGTLDPLAEGVLVVLTGVDTKKQDQFMRMEKEYIAEIGFGISTPSQDLETLPKISKKTIGLADLKKSIKDIISEFIGEIDQKVPSFSAIKVGGKRLYKRARKEDIAEDLLPSRKIKIYNIDILDTKRKEIETKEGLKIIPVVKMKIRCSSGTYIRSLARDLGKRLETEAVLCSLKRTKIGDLKIEDSIKVSKLTLQK